jgi:hypothetical protein
MQKNFINNFTNKKIFTVVQQLWLTYTMTHHEASATFVNWHIHGVYDGETGPTGTLF